nr:putative ribonuclease H protein [Ipomoea batatas]GMD48786.1 putative ribonuclease H protein [Ipomoea batatas]GMD95034.1 putative ribonuclease H protein [Ipomoea batatas]
MSPRVATWGQKKEREGWGFSRFWHSETPVGGLHDGLLAQCDNCPMKTRFRYAPVGSLNQATAYESPAHSSSGTRSEPRLLPLLGSIVLKSVEVRVLFKA